ncbi:MAG: nucleotidyltransferase domain-containing protein [Sphingomonadales bacterium]
MATIDPLTRRSIALFLAHVRTRYPIVEAWLYGSQATGSAREDSDVDLALVLDGTDVRTASSIAAEMGEATFEVLGKTGQYVSPLPIKLDLWRDPAKHSNPFLLANIRRDGIAL